MGKEYRDGSVRQCLFGEKMETHCSPPQKGSKPCLDRAGSLVQLKPGRLFGGLDMLIKEGSEGGVQSRENTEEIPQSNGGGFAQERKMAHPKTASK